jgi:hypothetical protein
MLAHRSRIDIVLEDFSDSQARRNKHVCHPVEHRNVRQVYVAVVVQIESLHDRTIRNHER